jgi:ABC-2 type transport system permease protein
MNHVLLFRTLSAQRVKLLVVMLALGLWGFLMPVVYAEFGQQFERLLESGVFPEEFKQLSEFGGADITTLPGSIALGFIHPLAVALMAVFAVGFTVAAVAGERQRGTLEILLARPISRRSLYGTLGLATLIFIGSTVVATLVGALVGATLWNVLDRLEVRNLPLLWLNVFLLMGAFAAIALAASVSFDRITPALGIALGVLLVSYFLQVLGSLWPDAEVLQPYSLFHYFQPIEILQGTPDPFDFVLLSVVIAIAVAFALVVFPRRDLGAPS